MTEHPSPTVTHAVWSQLPFEHVSPGITRQTLHASQQSVIRYVYAPGSNFPIHQHPEEQVTLVVSGQIEFTVADERLVMGAGEVAVIAPNVPHGARVIGTETVETFNILSPRRGTNPLAQQNSGDGVRGE